VVHGEQARRRVRYPEFAQIDIARYHRQAPPLVDVDCQRRIHGTQAVQRHHAEREGGELHRIGVEHTGEQHDQCGLAEDEAYGCPDLHPVEEVHHVPGDAGCDYLGPVTGDRGREKQPGSGKPVIVAVGQHRGDEEQWV
jgi:hypothetical protein